MSAYQHKVIQREAAPRKNINPFSAEFEPPNSENDRAADVDVCHIVDYPAGLIHAAFPSISIKNGRTMMFSHAPSHLNSSVKRRRTEGGFVVLWALGSAAFTFIEMAPLISNKAQGYACTKHINYLPPAHTVCSHLAKHCRMFFLSLLSTNKK